MSAKRSPVSRRRPRRAPLEVEQAGLLLAVRVRDAMIQGWRDAYRDLEARCLLLGGTRALRAHRHHFDSPHPPPHAASDLPPVRRS